MKDTVDDILAVLDGCAGKFTFPVLDNGYVYLAASRLSLYRSSDDWAMVIERFGFSPRAGLPDTMIYTFGSRLRRTRTRNNFVTEEAFERYLENNPNNESEFVFPLEEGPWIDENDCDCIREGKAQIEVRGNIIPVPPVETYTEHGIELADPPSVGIFEFCRYLASVARDDVLATNAERRICVPAELEQIMQLEDWRHPDVAGGEQPGSSATFRSLAEVLATGDTARYCQSDRPNTHWRNWPGGGTL